MYARGRQTSNRAAEDLAFFIYFKSYLGKSYINPERSSGTVVLAKNAAGSPISAAVGKSAESSQR
jgi:hypothetical protein